MLGLLDEELEAPFGEALVEFLSNIRVSSPGRNETFLRKLSQRLSKSINQRGT